MSSCIHRSLTCLLLTASRSQRQRAASRLAEQGLYPGQDIVLSYLWIQDGLSQSELNEHLGIEPPTLSRTLCRLEKAQFLERRPDPNDGRVWRVYLTSRGWQIQSIVEQIWIESEEALLGHLSAQEIGLLRGVLHKMQQDLTFKESL